MKLMNVLAVCGLISFASVAQATTVLYSQDFEHPTGFVNDGHDVNINRPVNALYGNQPQGFAFAQNYTVETLFLRGTSAFGHGYSDPSGTGGNYALGMLSSAQNDLLGLSFNIGNYKYLNLRMDISSIDLSSYGGPLVSPGDVPVFRFSLYDNPSGANGLGGGALLDFVDVTGVASERDVFRWTEALGALDATSNTNGNVTLVVDLLAGQYAALDNIRIAASDTQGDTGRPLPEPGSLALVAGGLTGLGLARRRRGTRV